MNARTSSRAVSFSRPFMLSGVGAVLPAGTYTVETEEELIQDLSFAAYRRVTTSIFLPPKPGTTVLMQIASIDPVELEAALDRDAMMETT
ncbi:MAG: hypothetical protein ACREEE_05805 [Dongiaceae bacterium]